MPAFMRAVSRLWLLGILAGLTLALHAPLLARCRTAIAGDLGDPLLNTWILWWNSQRLPFTDAYWHAPIFGPAPYALALSETLLGLTWLTTPLQWMGASALLAYNACDVITPVLNGLTAYWLCFTLTGRRDASLIGSLAFAFAPYYAVQLSHLQTNAMFFMPVALVALHRYWDTGRLRWLALLAAGVAMNGLVCGYFLLYFSVLLGLAIAWLAIASRDPKKLAGVVCALAAAAIALAPVASTYRHVRSVWDLRRSLAEIESFSADATSIAIGSRHLLLWPISTEPDRPEMAGYPGAGLGLLLVAGAAAAFRHRRRDVPGGRGRGVAVTILAAASGVALAAGVTAWAAGARQVSLGPLSLSAAGSYKPIGLGIDLALLAVMFSSRFAALVRSGSVAGLYATGGVAAWVFALGPVGRVFGQRFWYRPPFEWLMNVPGFDSIRAVALFSAIEVLCIAVLAALTIARLVPRPTRRSWVVIAMLAMVLVLDGWAVVPVVAVPRPLPVTVNADLVVELPTRGWVEDAAAMYRAITHGRRLVNGYSGYGPPHYGQLVQDLRNNCVDSLDAIRGGRSLDVVLWRDDPDAGPLDAALRTHWGTTYRRETPAVVLYHVPRSSARADEPGQGPPIDIRPYCDAARRQRPR